MELSLYQLESQLSELIEMREQTCESMKLAETEGDLPNTVEGFQQEIAVIDNAIREYITAEIRKVDSIRAFWRHCELMASAAKEEAEVQAARSKAWKNRLDRLKDTVKLVMETIPFPENKPKKLEGRTGALYLKANGGKQAVEIHDESLVPDELCTVTVTYVAAEWKAIEKRVAEARPWQPALSNVKVGQRVPSLSLIAERLAAVCPKCRGEKVVCSFCHGFDDYCADVQTCEVCIGTRKATELYSEPCPECGGSGRQSVPGARFAERGNHAECK